MNQFNVVKFIAGLPVARSIKELLEVYINSDEFEAVPFDSIKQAIIDKAEDLQGGVL